MMLILSDTGSSLCVYAPCLCSSPTCQASNSDPNFANQSYTTPNPSSATQLHAVLNKDQKNLIQQSTTANTRMNTWEEILH